MFALPSVHHQSEIYMADNIYDYQYSGVNYTEIYFCSPLDCILHLVAWFKHTLFKRKGLAPGAQW